LEPGVAHALLGSGGVSHPPPAFAARRGRPAAVPGNPQAAQEVGKGKAWRLTPQFEERKPVEIDGKKKGKDVEEIKHAIEEEEGAK